MIKDTNWRDHVYDYASGDGIDLGKITGDFGFSDDKKGKEMEVERRKETSTKSILEDARRTVNGERNEDYGCPIKLCKKISDIFLALTGIEIGKENVPLLMLVTKLCRESHRHKRDNLVDIAGYVEIWDRIIEDENKHR